ncbi:MAG TPA: FecR domain-containing protein [Chitinophaga sp.]|uniref:FecR family protein n=1 Tax=Chitinophaga sp. TaxID=1869181 RepID=UPI002CAE05CC|nr:FecR domain-containing protein [Chitinophaga sp.]HVI43509.1 FecR domain-containing protein [Chitinophaga sp.]
MEYELLRRYFDGNCTEAETAAVDEWLADEGQELDVLQQLMADAWEEPVTVMLRKRDASRLLYALRRNIGHKPKVTPVRRMLMVATAVAAILLMIVLHTQWSRSSQEKDVESAMSWEVTRNESLHTHKVIMPDNTIIWLAPFSTLSYNVPYGKTARIVQLEGEAYFEVAGNERSPFIVITDRLMTYVLGTAFNIEAYPEEPAVRVALTSGKVAVSDIGEKYTQVLRPGQQLTSNRETAAMTLKPVAVKDNSLWGKGYLILNDIPLEQAVARVAARYGWHVSWRVDRSVLADKKVTAVFRHETDRQIIRNLLFVHGYHYILQGNKLLITPE